MKIESTKNYAQFKTIGGNRKLSQPHLAHLGNSIAEKNMLEYYPIIVNENMEVIDGQHRLTVAQAQNLEIYYVVVKGAGLTEVQRLNANIRSWGVMDFMFSYMERGLEDYKILYNFCKKYRLPVTTALNLLSIGPSKTNETTMMKKFRNGTFKVSHLEEAVAFADQLRRLQPYCEGFAWRSREFLVALGTLSTSVPLEMFVNKVVNSGLEIRRETRQKDYLLTLEEIWNAGTSKAEQVHFF